MPQTALQLALYPSSCLKAPSVPLSRLSSCHSSTPSLPAFLQPRSDKLSCVRMPHSSPESIPLTSVYCACVELQSISCPASILYATSACRSLGPAVRVLSTTLSCAPARCVSRVFHASPRCCPPRNGRPFSPSTAAAFAALLPWDSSRPSRSALVAPKDFARPST